MGKATCNLVMFKESLKLLHSAERKGRPGSCSKEIEERQTNIHDKNKSMSAVNPKKSL